jgi:magnesium transporter
VDRVLKIYRNDGRRSEIEGLSSAGVIWIDLLNPTSDEKASVERTFAVKIASKESFHEIEAAGRLLSEHNRLYLTTPVVRLDEHDYAHLTPVGFIVTPNVLVTIRFASLTVFDIVEDHLVDDDDLEDGMFVFVALLEAIVDRGADVLEHLGSTTDGLSREIFDGGLRRNGRSVRSSRTMREALETVGMMTDRLSRARDVMLGVQRIAAFAATTQSDWVTQTARKRLDSVSRDVVSLSDYETRLSDKIQLLLDAVLGFINIQQNDLFKVLTIVSTVGVLPTILVGIWGMNFKNIHEFTWDYGYPLALLTIVVSALLPLLWFKWRGWLD